MTASFTYKAKRLLPWIVLIITTARAYQMNEDGYLPNLTTITNILVSILRPYIKSFQSSGILLNRKESEIEHVIKEKIKDLKPYLQDYDKINEIDDENLTLEGKDETTIIELLPTRQDKKGDLRQDVKKTEPFKTTVKKYKKLRQKIDKALTEESVSNRTKKLVTETLDELTAQLLGSQCIWKAASLSSKQFRQRNNGSQTRRELDDSWYELWQKLKEKYVTKLSSNKEHERNNKILYFFEQFNEFFTFMLKEMQMLANIYKIKCELVKTDDILNEKHNFKDLRQGINNNNSIKDTPVTNNKDECLEFKVCSEELNQFMMAFYKTINDTAVSTLRNFAAMYIRDVNADASREKETVVNLINKIGDKLEHKVSKIFIKETMKLRLDEKKDKQENIKALSKYIKTNINRVKQQTIKLLKDNLNPLRDKLKQTVHDDIKASLNVELNNLERDIIGRICTVFKVCNGIFESRRHIYHTKEKLPGDKNSVYVKVQLTLDDDLKDKLFFSGYRKSMYSVHPKKYKPKNYLALINKQAQYGSHQITTKMTTDYKKYNMPRATRTTQDFNRSLTTLKMVTREIIPHTTI